MEGEILNKLFLELSQITKARTAREIELARTLSFVRSRMQLIDTIGHTNGYDWDADKDNLVLIQAEAFGAIRVAIDGGDYPITTQFLKS